MIPTRTFQAKIRIGNWILIFMLLIVSVYFIWVKSGIFIAVSLLLLLLVIERSIHTEYRLTEDAFVLHRGRLSKDIVIPWSEVDAIQHFPHNIFFGAYEVYYTIIWYSGDKNLSVFPNNEDLFYEQFNKYLAKHSLKGRERK